MKLVAILLAVMGLLVYLIPLGCWIVNPELTQMQAFLKYWHWLVLGSMLMATSQFMLGGRRRRKW